MKHSLFSRLFPTPEYLRLPALGLDISDRSVKYAQLRPGKHPSLGIFGEERIESGVIEGGVIKNQPALVEVLRRIRTRSREPFVHACLPEEKAYVVDIELPYGRSQDLRETIGLHLDEHVPLEPVGAFFDFETVPDSKGSRNPGAVEVALSAVEQTLAEQYLRALEEALFTPISFELESQALGRALLPRGSTETVMIVDIGRKQSNLSIVSAGLVRLASSLDLGGDAITEAIMTDLGLSAELARAMKEKDGLLGRGKERNAFPSIIRALTALRDEIFQRFSYWSGAHRERVSRILLCGGNSSIPGLAGYFASGVPVPVAVANPWVNIASFEEYIPEIPAREALKYSTALGLALRNFELTPV